MTPTDGAAVRATLTEHTALLTGPDVPEPVAARVSQLSALLDDLLDAPGPVGDLTVPALAFVAEQVGAYQRMPAGYAASRPLEDERTALQQLVDALDLLALTLVRGYDAATRDDAAGIDAQAAVLAERFATKTDPDGVPTAAAPIDADLDTDQLERDGLVVGADGIPRVPVPTEPEGPAS